MKIKNFYKRTKSNWKTATGYFVSTSKTVSFKVSLNYNIQLAYSFVTHNVHFNEYQVLYIFTKK